MNRVNPFALLLALTALVALSSLALANGCGRPCPAIVCGLDPAGQCGCIEGGVLIPNADPENCR